MNFTRLDDLLEELKAKPGARKRPKKMKLARERKLKMPLQVTMPSTREVVVTRTFGAPRHLVWDCHTQPELVRRWLVGPDGWTMVVCEIDLRVGGTYRYRWRNDETGFEFGSSGIHKEIAAPERIVTTEQMEGFEGEATNTLVLTEANGQTTLTLTMEFASEQARDGAVKTGMTDGMETSYARLDGMLAASA